MTSAPGPDKVKWSVGSVSGQSESEDDECRNTSVCVANFDPSCTVDEFKHRFGNCGRVVQVVFGIDESVDPPTECACVTFTTEEGRKNALGMDGRYLLGIPMRVTQWTSELERSWMPSDRPKDGPGSGRSCSSSESNDASDVDQQSVSDSYADSTCTEMSRMMGEPGLFEKEITIMEKSRSSGFLQTLEARPSTSAPLKRRASAGSMRQSVTKMTKSASLQVLNIESSCTEDDIRNHFCDCGDIDRIVMPMKSDGTRHAYVAFAAEEGRTKALALSGSSLKGATIEVAEKTRPAVPAMFDLQTSDMCSRPDILYDEKTLKQWDFRYRETVQVFTDGSYIPGPPHASSIAVFFCDDHPLNDKYPLPGPEHSSGLAEIAAAQAALSKIAKVQDYRSKPICICTDYDGIIQAMQPGAHQNRAYAKEYADLRHQAESFEYGVVFEHRHGHDGDYGNQQADRLAREALNLRPVSATPSKKKPGIKRSRSAHVIGRCEPATTPNNSPPPSLQIGDQISAPIQLGQSRKRRATTGNIDNYHANEATSGVNAVYVTNVDCLCTKDDIVEHFRECGDVSVLLIPHDTFADPIYAYLVLPDRSSKIKAYKKNGTYILGRRIGVSDIPPNSH